MNLKCISITLIFTISIGILSTCSNEPQSTMSNNSEKISTQEVSNSKEEIETQSTSPSEEISNLTTVLASNIEPPKKIEPKENIKENTSTSSPAASSEKNIDEEYLMNIKKQVRKSDFKNCKNCKEIYDKYAKVVNRLLDNNDESALDQLIDWVNDPLIEACKKKEPFKTQFEKFDELLE